MKTGMSTAIAFRRIAMAAALTALIVLALVATVSGCATMPTDNDATLRGGLDELFANTIGDEQYRIAVLPLVDFRTEEQDELGSYIANDVVYQISVAYSDRIQMVERQLITQIMEELELNTMSGMITESDVKEIGEMAGADFVVIGTKLELEDAIQANLRLVDVESAEIRGVTRIDLAITGQYAALLGGGADAPARSAPATTPTASATPAAGDEAPSRATPAAPLASLAGATAADNPWTAGRDLTGATVTVIGAFTDEEAERFRAAMGPFERITGITIVYEESYDPRGLVERVQRGSPPDVAAIPQLGLARYLAGEGALQNMTDWLGASYLRSQYRDAWLRLAQVDGMQAGVWYRTTVKSLVWYNRTVFEREGYRIPRSWDEMIRLSDRMVTDGYVPWSVGIESGGATGWVATDWLEDIMLRIHPPTVYDRWIRGDVRFDSPEFRQALDYLDSIWFRDGYILGGRRAITETSFMEAVAAISGDRPTAVMHRQASFAPAFMAEAGAEVGDTVGVFYLPPIDPRMGTPVVTAGDLMCAFQDRPEVRAAMRYFSQGISTRQWLVRGGFISPHQDTPLVWYPDETGRRIATILSEATVFRFDGSDLMPPAVGSDAFWRGMTEYVRSAGANRDEILREIDRRF